MSSIRIYNYEILNFDPEPVIFSAAGFTRITEPKLVTALNHLTEFNSQLIHHNELQDLLTKNSLEPEPTIEFLKSLSIIKESQQPPHIERIVLWLDWELPSAVEDWLVECSGGLLSIVHNCQLSTENRVNPTLFILAHSKLKPASARKTYFELAKNNPDGAISIGFISNHYFHLTEPYVPSIGNPCAFCTLDRIAHYETIRGSNHQWSQIWKFCNTSNVDLPRTHLNPLQSALILGAIGDFASRFTHLPKSGITQDAFLLSKTLNLTDGSLIEESSIHWPLCECIGDKP